MTKKKAKLKVSYQIEHENGTCSFVGDVSEHPDFENGSHIRTSFGKMISETEFESCNTIYILEKNEST